MKRTRNIFLLLIFSSALFASGLQTLLHDYKQNNDLQRKYRAILLLSKRKYIPILSDFVNCLLKPRKILGNDFNKAQGVRRIIAKSLQNYAGVPYNELTEEIGQILVYMDKMYNIEIAGDLILSVAIILHKNGRLNHKVIFLNKVKNLVFRFNRLSRNNAEYYNGEDIFAIKTVKALKILKHKKSIKILSMMLNLRYRNRVYNLIRKTLDKIDNG